jgi:small subunit ribosomal protein S8
MSMTDPIADLRTRIRNINSLGRKRVSVPYSRIKEEILKTLLREGYIDQYEMEGDGPQRALRVTLKYGPEGEKVITRIERVSKPGCRVYSGAKQLPRVMQGLGILIVSTPTGVLSDNEARTQNVGGEILVSVC